VKNTTPLLHISANYATNNRLNNAKNTKYSFGAKTAIALFIFFSVAVFSFTVWTALGGEL